MERGGRRQTARETEAAFWEKKQKSADCDQVSLFFQPWRDELKKKARRKLWVGSTSSGVRIRVSFVVASRRDAACASETASSERARAYRRPLPPHPPRTTRGSCPRRARTPPRLSRRIENVRGVSSSEGRERSRLAYGIRCAFFRVPETRAKKGDVRASRVRSAHLPRRLCRRCRTRLRPGTGPIR